jgi:predicted Zn-dependent protease
MVEEADSAYQALLEDFGPDPDVWRRLAELNYYRDDLAKALAYSMLLIERATPTPEDFSRALDVTLIGNMRDRAEALIHRSIASACYDTPFLEKAEHFLVDARREDSLITVQQRLVTRNTDDVQRRVALAENLKRQGDYAGAADQYRRVLAKKPDDIATRVGLIAVLFSKRDVAAAQREIDALLARGPRKESTLQLVGELIPEGRLAEAAELLALVVHDEPRLRRRLAVLYEWLDRPELARQQYELLLEADPDSIELRGKVAQCHLWLGNHATAYRLLAVIKDPPLALRRMRGEAAHAMGRTRQAVADLEHYLRRHPEDRAVEDLLAEACAKLGWREKARRHARRGLRRALREDRAMKLRRFLSTAGEDSWR